MSEFKISIIVPVYNVESYLPQCINSLIQQSYNHLEIICINDGSTDNSGTICDEYARKDSRIRIIHKENSGVSDTRNIGIKNATGDYIMFLDSDDWLSLDTCNLALNAAQTYDADLVFWSYSREYENHSLPKKIIDTQKEFIIYNEQQVRSKLHRRLVGLIKEELKNPENMDSFVPVCVKLYRADLIKNNKLRFMDIRIIGTGEDTIFNINALTYVKKAVYINKELYFYRRDNQNSLTRSQNHELFFKWKKLFSIIRNYLVINNFDPIYYEAFNNRICLSFIGIGMNIVKDKKITFTKRIKLLNEVLLDMEFDEAIRNLSLSYFDKKWKLFFLFAKYKISLPLYLMLIIMVKKTSR